jgi:ABC-type phosphate/phosphonate transport system substrate-binding protein
VIASLPMYDRPSTATANDLFWATIRDALRAAGRPAPQALSRDGDVWAQWTAPDLVLSQTCGMPYRTRLHGRVALVGTPDYGLADCPPGHYRSRIVVRADDPRETLAAFHGARLAINAADSQSGWAALANHAPGLVWSSVAVTGAHALSAAAVAAGQADLAAVDAVSWALFEAEGAAAGLRVLASTPATPGLPLIAAPGSATEPLAEAVAAAIAALPEDTRARLRLRGLVRLPPECYLAVPTPPPPARFVRAA